MMEEGGEQRREGPIFRDIRRYSCEYCGITRSKKTLITSHILSHHQYQEGGPPEKLLQRPFTCPFDDCHSSYRRKDHLSRHLLQHEGKLFECPNCEHRFAFQGNLKRHVREFHEESASSDIEAQKQFVCPEAGCGKTFKYASKLRKHEDCHVKLETLEVFCAEPGCMKSFTNDQCLKAHLQSCHQHITCEICGSKQLKKNIKRHLCTHEGGVSSERVKCTFKDCLHTFSNKSNLNQHIKAVHFEQKPFVCSIPGCGMRFPFKHVRDNHEKTACHLFTPGDFVVSDEQFQSRQRGGRKRVCPAIIETITRKRIVPPCESDSIFYRGSDYVSWMLSSGHGQ